MLTAIGVITGAWLMVAVAAMLLVPIQLKAKDEYVPFKIVAQVCLLWPYYLLFRG